MKPLTNVFQAFLAVLSLVTILSGSASAALRAVGPIDSITTLPAFYQDLNNLALQPCLDQNGFCILPPPFDPLTSVPLSPITTTGPITDANFPSEAFYYSAGALMNIEGGKRPGWIMSLSTPSSRESFRPRDKPFCEPTWRK